MTNSKTVDKDWIVTTQWWSSVVTNHRLDSVEFIWCRLASFCSGLFGYSSTSAALASVGRGSVVGGHQDVSDAGGTESSAGVNVGGLTSCAQHHSTPQMSRHPASYADRRLQQLRGAVDDDKDAMHRFKSTFYSFPTLSQRNARNLTKWRHYWIGQSQPPATTAFAAGTLPSRGRRARNYWN